MKKCSSVAWRFFDRIENDAKRCVAVVCKLCDAQYKFYGNTTNLRTHLINKHPLQWELAQNGTFEESSLRTEEDESNQSEVAPKRRRYTKGYKDKNVDVLDTSDIINENDAEENEATYNLVRQLHDSRGSDEEWLEDDHYTTTANIDSIIHKTKRVPYRKIKREVQSPPLRISTYNQRSTKYEKPSPIIIEQSNLKDEYSVFGEYVANKLRKFKAPRTRGNLQQLITTILWQAEYGTYDNADSVKRVLMYTTHESENCHVEEVHVQSETVIEQRDEELNQSVNSDSLIQ